MHLTMRPCTFNTRAQRGGNPRLLEVMREKDALYTEDPFPGRGRSNKAAELEAEFAG